MLMLCCEGSAIQLLRIMGKSLNYCDLTGGLFSILLFTGHPYNLKIDLVTAKAHLAKELFLFPQLWLWHKLEQLLNPVLLAIQRSK